MVKKIKFKKQMVIELIPRGLTEGEMDNNINYSKATENHSVRKDFYLLSLPWRCFTRFMRHSKVM